MPRAANRLDLAYDGIGCLGATRERVPQLDIRDGVGDELLERRAAFISSSQRIDC